MQKEKISFDGMTLVGLTVRTNNKNEMDPSTRKIGPLIDYYWQHQIAQKIQYRSDAGKTYVAYTDYESNEHGEYTFFVGESVSSPENQDESQFRILLIPKGNFQKFTTESGKMPDNIIHAWQKIWAMSPDELGGQRNYIADFEVYDRRAMDPNNAIIDIYIGVK